MVPFLAAQAEAPFDSAPLLILADRMEEQGDLTGTGVLRGLVEAGYCSLHALAIEVALFQDYRYRDQIMTRLGDWSGAGAEDNHGLGDGWDATGSGRADGSGERNGSGVGDDGEWTDWVL